MRKRGKKVIAFYLVLVIILSSFLPSYFTPKAQAETPTYEVFERGCKVKVGEEEFYVVKDSAQDEENVTLLAAKCVDVTTLSQSDSASEISFSTTPYWDGIYNQEGNLNVNSEPEEDHIALYYAWKYGEKVGANIGRLPETEEFNIMHDAEYRDQFKKILETQCWSSTIGQDNMIKCLNREFSVEYNKTCFLRPVIEINKDLVTKIYYSISYDETGLSHITVSFDKSNNIRTIDSVIVTITPDEGYEFITPIEGNLEISTIGSTIASTELKGDGSCTVRLKDFYANELLTIIAKVDLIDLEKPNFSGVFDGKTYCEDQHVVITDNKELISVTINGESKVIGGGVFELPGTPEGKYYTITAVDKAGNSATISCRVYNECDYSDFDCFALRETDEPKVLYKCKRNASHTTYYPAAWELSEVLIQPTVDDTGLGLFVAAYNGKRSEEKVRRVIPKLEKADYSKVEEAIAEIPENLSNYTDESALKVITAKNDVNWKLPEDEQATVDGYAKKIRDAISELVLKPADYSELDELLSAIRIINLDNYTDETVSVLNTAKDAVVRDKTIDEQEVVDQYVRDITIAKNQLKLKPADYTKVNEALEKTKNITRKFYTTATLTALDNSIAAVVEGKKITEQETVDGYATDIENALTGLQIKPGREVEALIDDIRKIDLSIYTDETVAELEAAISEGDGKEFADQTAVDECIANIQKAKQNLVLKPADYSKVNEAKRKASEINRDLYTSTSLKNLDDAVNAVVEGKKITEQNTVDGYASNIENALNALNYSPADYSKVDIQKANAGVVNRNLYTDESLAELDKALSEVEEGKGANEQDVVNGYAIKIENALKNLKYLPASYNTLNDLLKEIRKLNLSDYTDESVKTLNNLMITIRMDKNITEQAEVDQYVVDLENAKQGLVLRAADYTKVNQAKNDASKVNRKLYTSESIAKLDEALNAVEEGKSVLEQATVDGYATAIMEALKGLTYVNNDVGTLVDVIAEIKSMNFENYTSETVKVLTDLIAKIEQDENITNPETIKQYLQEIEAAKQGLLLKSADYTAVNKVREQAKNVDRSVYTEDSLKKMDDAVNAVIEGKKITEQATVDGYARNIEKAIENLVRKEAPKPSDSTNPPSTGTPGESTNPTPTPTPSPTPTPNPIVNPGTGDNIFDNVVMLIISIVGLVVIRIIKKMN